MQDLNFRDQISLNGVRAFEAAARLRSLKAAAAELGVTASAISHQIRHLEKAIGATLFVRGHNAVELTRDGASFFDDVSPAIRAILRARRAVARDPAMVVIKSNRTLLMRWLLPRLRQFQTRHPRIRVSVETFHLPLAIGSGTDIALFFMRRGAGAPDGVSLMKDLAIPVRAPMLRQPSGLKGAPLPYPIIASSTDAWEWLLYAGEAGLDFRRFRIAERFDSDDACARASLAGLGVSLQTRAFIEDELASGDFVPVDGLPEVEFGTFWMSVAQPARPAVETFSRWLREQAALTYGG